MGGWDDMKILIVDDSIEDSKILEAKISMYFTDYQIKLLNNLDQLYEIEADLLFLDVVINDQESFLFGQKYLELYPNSTLIFISSYDHFIYQSYHQNSFFFIRKSNFNDDFKQFVEKYNYRQTKRNQTLPIVFQKQKTNVLLNEIIYIKSKRNQVYIYTNHITYTAYQSLSDTARQLKQSNFHRFNGHIIINLDHIKEIGDKKLLMTSDIELNYTRGSLKKLLEAYQIYRRNRIWAG